MARCLKKYLKTKQRRSEMDKCYEKISEIMTPILPKNWEKVCLYGELGDGSYEFFFYVKIDNVYVQCFDMEKKYNISKNEVSDVFKSLSNVVKTDENMKNSVYFTFTLKSDGSFKTDYEYEEYTNIVTRNKVWKEKFLI